MIPEIEKPEEHDIQGLVARGYGKLQSACFLLLRVDQAAPARAYLRSLRVTPASVSPEDLAIQVAFSHDGLAALEVPADALATFSREFIEGMHPPHRATILGDHSQNDPTSWKWGVPPVHVMLMIYANGEPLLAVSVEREQRAAEASGLRVVATKQTRWLPDSKEHFGFRDGISMASAEGLGSPSDPGQARRLFKAGEFVLGYRNEYGHYTESPTVDPARDPAGDLPATRDGSMRDLGRNGTYLVYRELAQEVVRFWKYLEEVTREPAADRAEGAIKLAAKMVGRWPGGAPLVGNPDQDPGKSDANEFGFWDEDPHGLACPLGSHIRRTNPRDQLPIDHDQSDSIEMVRKHQLLRRGRTFGEPLVASMDPRDVLKTPDDGKTRGLHFICLVGHISRQFEFVQSAWVKAPNFAGLFKDGDPIIGARRPAPDPNLDDEFTCPAEPLRRKYKQMPPFTRLLGGGYFFLPGLRALRFIASDRT